MGSDTTTSLRLTSNFGKQSVGLPKVDTSAHKTQKSLSSLKINLSFKQDIIGASQTSSHFSQALNTTKNSLGRSNLFKTKLQSKYGQQKVNANTGSALSTNQPETRSQYSSS